MRTGVVGVAETDTVPAQHRWKTGSVRNRQARSPLSVHHADSQCSCSIEETAEAKENSDPFSRWELEVAKYRARHKAIIAFANNMGRFGWVVLAKDLLYNPQL